MDFFRPTSFLRSLATKPPATHVYRHKQFNRLLIHPDLKKLNFPLHNIISDTTTPTMPISN